VLPIAGEKNSHESFEVYFKLFVRYFRIVMYGIHYFSRAPVCDTLRNNMLARDRGWVVLCPFLVWTTKLGVVSQRHISAALPPGNSPITHCTGRWVGRRAVPDGRRKEKISFDVCVTVHHVWKWREVPTWCNNCDLLSLIICTCFRHLYAHLHEYRLYVTAYVVLH
jgi:hypothetical protein